MKTLHCECYLTSKIVKCETYQVRGSNTCFLIDFYTIRFPLAVPGVNFMASFAAKVVNYQSG